MAHVFDAALVVSFPADDMDAADAILDALIEQLEGDGYKFESAALGESVVLSD